MNKKILVTGGAGYIGSFVVRSLKENGYDVVILDNFVAGHKQAVSEFRIEEIDLVSQNDKLLSLFKEEKFDAVIHMASLIQMGESYQNPAIYYKNNVVGFLNLLDAMIVGGCKNIIISSSAGVYGIPKKLPIKEEDPKNPLNPYGETKYILEKILRDYDTAYGIKHVAFRYFNAAGASLDGQIGEAHPNESHLIPNVIQKILNGKEVQIFGNDYDTDDGTCVRDYIHVLDLAEAHLKGLSFLFGKKESLVVNIGIGKGYSNKEIVGMVEKLSGLSAKVSYLPRRLGDADKLYASNGLALKMLNWKPKYGLEEIIATALLWHKKHPMGYTVI